MHISSLEILSCLEQTNLTHF